MNGAQLEQRVKDRLKLVGMEEWHRTKIRKYSKGMMQRLGLAQALINDPQLVILDEPTDGVDPLGRKQIRDMLMQLRDQGKTIFLNSHLLSEVEMICDRVAILNKGRLIRIGSVKELTVQDNLYRVGIHGEVPDELLLEWEARRVSVQREDNALLLGLDDVEALNAALDRLRHFGVLITEISLKRQSLEDMFIDVISREEKA
jgi:ABC-2 type transport system ATP-binding protein